jgi:isopenicillin-N N-acyltransferase-like protein
MTVNEHLFKKVFPFHRLSGTHRETGRQLGEECSQLVRTHRDLALARLRTRAGISAREAFDSAFLYRPSVIQFAPFLDEEIQGVAEGAGLTLAEACLLQLRAELAVPITAALPPSEEGQECTTFAVLNGATADRTPLIGQNADLPMFYREISVVVEVHSDDLPAVLMLTPAGQVSYISINDQGVGAFANFLTCDGWRIGFPRYLLTRLVLTQSSIQDTSRLVESIHRASSRNLIMLDGHNQAVDLEITPICIGRLEPQNGVLAHTNHFISEELLDWERSPEPSVGNSRIRLSRIWELMETNRGRLDVEMMQSILCDRTCYPDALCRMPGDKDSDTITFASVIAQPTLGQMWIALGPPNQHIYRCYSFSS